MPDIKFTMDSTCDMDAGLKKRFDIAETVPLFVSLGDQGFPDNDSFDVREIYKHVEKTKKLPKTAAASVQDFQDAFEKLTADGGSVVHFSISSELSASYQNAVLASREVKNVYVVDGLQLSTGTSLLALKARDILRENPGITAESLSKTAAALAKKVQTSFCVDTISYLHKGGRCSALSLLGANILKIHPSLHMREGFIKVGKKYRGRISRVFSEYISDLLDANPNYDDTRCFVTYTLDTDPEAVEAAKQKTRELFRFKELLETTAGPTVTSHCGKGTLGLLFMNK